MGPVLLFIFAVIVLATFWRLVEAVLRLTVAFAVGVVAALLAQMILTVATRSDDEDITSAGLVGGAVIFVLTTVLMYRHWARREERRTRSSEGQASLTVQLPVPSRRIDSTSNWVQERPAVNPSLSASRPPEGPILPPALDQALVRASRLAPGHTDALGRARHAYVRLLARETDSLDQAVLDAAATLRNQLPSLIEETAVVCDGASPAERRVHVAAMLAAIEQMTSTAEEEQAWVRAATQRTLSARLAHIAGRAGRTVPR